MRMKGMCLILGALMLAACVPARVVIRDQARAKEVKKIVVLPFFSAERLTVERLASWEKGFGHTVSFVKAARASLGDRYEFIIGQPVVDELVKHGDYAAYEKGKKGRERTGYTIQDGLKVGEALGADAVVIGSGSYSQQGPAMSVRLVDVGTKQVIWGGTAIKQGLFDSAPAAKIAKKIAMEVK